ncbi:ABC transporter permease [Ascidiimonas sp. W6]|uniref:fluoroquinolone export ABC transporter permease subunit n=1 Tax=Ascidiimonas meishanensis TaxID=3128903 RepID=UPI0030EB29DD
MESMKNNFNLLYKALKWDFYLQKKYNILLIALIISIFYAVCWKIIGNDLPGEVLVILIFSDPAMLGFLFIGVLLLTDKGSRTLQVFNISPLSTEGYIWSKTISLTIITIFCSLVITIAAHGLDFNFIYLLLGVILSSTLFIFIGFIAVSLVNNFNEYVFVLPFFMLPLCIPFLNYFGITNTKLFYLIPTQASLILLDTILHKNTDFIQIMYAIGYLILWNFIGYIIAKKFYKKFLIKQ